MTISEKLESVDEILAPHNFEIDHVRDDHHRTYLGDLTGVADFLRSAGSSRPVCSWRNEDQFIEVGLLGGSLYIRVEPGHALIGTGAIDALREAVL